MANREEGLTERLLECAKIEFLAKGYKDASLRDIARKAGSSKGAIYIRYADKASLFEALVVNALKAPDEMMQQIDENFSTLPIKEQQKSVRKVSDFGISHFIDYIYKYFDEFKLLLTCSEGSVYTNFIHRFVEMDVAITSKYIQDIHGGFVEGKKISTEFLHILSESYYRGVFEVVFHDMPRQEGEDYILRLRKFFLAGWQTIFKEL